MKEYRTTYATITSREHEDQELRPVVPSDGSAEHWALIGTAAAVDDSGRAVVFWTWQNDRWWQPPGQTTQRGDPRQ